MKYVPYAIIAALIAIAFIWYGNAQYDKGYAAYKLLAAEKSVKEQDKAVKEKSKNEAKFKAMPTSDIDKYGLARGWVRDYEDR